MTFPSFWFLTFLNHMGWPQIKGLSRKQVISCVALWGGLGGLVRAGIALGALRPRIAVSLLADLLSERDWSRRPATEFWNDFDPSQQVAKNSDKSPEEVIMGMQSPWDFFEGTPLFNKILRYLFNPKGLIEWESILTDEFSVHYHAIFIKGLVWGLSHPEEALTRHEEQRQKHLKNLPDMVSHRLDVHSPETLEEFADAMEESVNTFQDEIRPFARVPKELLSLPAIATRLNAV